MFSAERYGPWAVITGGSEGVGAAFAHRLAEAGINLVLVARREEPLARTAGEIRAAHSVEVRTLALDVAAPDAIDRIKAATEDVAVGLLICNIGSVFCGGPYEKNNPEKIAKSILLNPMSQALLSRHFGRPMVERGHGGVIFVGSMAGNAGSPLMAMYGATKAFEQNRAEALWFEWRPKGVDVLYMVLGATDTPKRASQGVVDEPDMIIQSSDEVAQQGLANLGNGPIHVPAHMTADFASYATPDRGKATEAMAATLMSFADKK